MASSGSPPPTESSSAELDRVKFWVAIMLFVSFPILLVFLLYALNFLFGVIQGPRPQGHQPVVDLSTVEKMALAASVQVAIGMVMGFVSVFIGLMMTWFGINAAYEFSGKAGERGDVTLKSASPGLIFFLGGIILIWVSLYKKITYEEPGQVTAVRMVGKPDVKVHDVSPAELPPLNRVEK